MIPFPLASGRYEVGPGMRRFGQAGQGFPAEEGHFCVDDLLAQTLAAKLSVLQQAAHQSHLFAPAAEPDGLAAALRATFGLLAEEHPRLATLEHDGVMLHHLGVWLNGWTHLVVVGDGWWPVAREIQAWLAGRTGLELLAESLALSVQEDLAMVRGPAVPGEPDLLEWLHVCLPSNWAPAEKVGGSFAAVHEPVVHSERLINSQAQILRAMIHSGPFVRYVWGIHRDGELCHNPRVHQAPPWEPGRLVEQAWFRVERQTTHGFPEFNRALFTIRYWVEPLAVTASDPYQRERLASALAAMSPEELAYKGLTPARDGLVAWLQQPSR